MYDIYIHTAFVSCDCYSAMTCSEMNIRRIHAYLITYKVVPQLYHAHLITYKVVPQLYI